MFSLVRPSVEASVHKIKEAIIEFVKGQKGYYKINDSGEPYKAFVGIPEPMFDYLSWYFNVVGDSIHLSQFIWVQPNACNNKAFTVTFTDAKGNIIKVGKDFYLKV